MSHDNNYYFAPHQNGQSYGNYSIPQSSNQGVSAQYQGQSTSDHSNTDHYSRYQQGYNYASAPDSSRASSNTGSGTTWYANSAVPNSSTSYSRTSSDRYGSANYSTTQSASALGKLAYASTLNANPSSNSNTSSTSGLTSYHQGSQNQTQGHARPSQSTQYNSYAPVNPQYGQQQQNRPNSVNSVGSTNSTVSPAPHTQPSTHQRVSSASHRNIKSPLATQAHLSSDAARRNQSPVYNYNNRPDPHRTQGTTSQASYSRDNTMPQQRQQNDQGASAQRAQAPVTVDPSEVYDPSHEYERQKAKREAEAKTAADTKRREEEARKKQNQNQAQQKVAAPNVGSEPSVTSSAKKRSRKPATKSKGQKNQQSADADADAAAAMTLVQTANSSKPTSEQLEAEMRLMFAKMREYNAENPELLSKLWQQERDQHLAKQSPTTKKKTPAAATAKQSQAASSSKTADSKKGGKKTATATPQSPSAMPAPTARQVNARQDKAPLASESKTSGTADVWPPSKREALAKAAVRLLPSYPGNQGKTITTQDMLQILVKNPDYQEMCSGIVKRGFKFDKSAFARDLLRAVPDIKTSASPASAGQNTTSASAQGSAVSRLMNGATVAESEVEPTAGKASPKAKKGKQSQTSGASGPSITTNGSHAHEGAAPNVFDPSLGGLDAIKQFNERPQDPPASATSSAAPKPALKGKREPKARPSATPLPPNKEDMARKRTFGDLVDLSQLSDDDLQIPPAQSPAHQGSSNDNGRTAADSQLPTPPGTDKNVSDKPPGGPEEVAPVANMAAPITKNPGPTDSLQQAPTAVVAHNTPSNKATALDPIEMTPAQVISHLPHDHPVRNTTLVQTLDRNKALRRSTYNARTIARDVLLASKRHPEMRPLNVHMEILRQRLPGFSSHLQSVDLDTIRWDLIDPGGPEPGSATAAMRPSAVDEANMADDEGDSDNDSVLGEVTPAARQAVTADGSMATTSTLGPHLSGPKKRIGRPPKYRISDPGFLRAAAEPIGNPAKRPRNSEGMTQAAPTADPAGSGYSAFRQLNADGTKKRGRPVGWRKHMQKTPAEWAATTKGSGVKQKEQNKRPPSPKYQVYKCEWKGCGVGLHNLATLRKHLHKKHGAPDGDGAYTCMWTSCGKVAVFKDGPRTVSRFESYKFDELEPWKKHVEDAHLTPIAWSLGDGPPGGLSGGEASENSDAYMSDAQGRRVTPLVPMPTVEERAAMAEQEAARSGAGKGRKPAEEAARKEEAEALERRRRLGAGVDREGSDLVTPKRAQGFIDDDVEMGEGEVVAGSDDDMG
ncbi:MAG: hypothetical protein M1828_003904 [Chrysothrix sp. TS-e1954]|nr:MAG: hypothetical protein M1828_003904 [Chrysothrix sp. TS-e1954]